MGIRAAFLIAACLSSRAVAQPSMAIRFDNGLSEITVAPGSQVHVRVWATGMPALGAQIPWTTPPGTGQIGRYEGFLSVLFRINGSGGSWSGIGVAPGHGFPGWPGGGGSPQGSNVTGINIGVGFNPPVTDPEFDLWYGTITVASTDVQLSTLISLTGAPPQLGFEVALSGIMPPLNVSQFVATLNGAAVIHVPVPGGLSVLALGCCTLGRRRR
ncbi:MAG: hypothetical protein IT437_11625 [Phycisphaerales bacterium]|nr:hypothetical protein [Phycisphaerales bacterium]